jgi:hypothetical protein
MMQTWQKRYLILRDAWTVDGDTTLELYLNEPAATVDSLDDASPPGSDGGVGRRYVVNLRTVMYVDIYKDSKSYPNAFIVFRY